MHELSLAVSLVDEVESILKRENARKVLRVSVSIGELSGVEKEPFEFCFPLAAEGTPLEQAMLDIEEVSAVLHCQDCGARTQPEVPFLICAKCRSSNVSIVEGREFLITSLEVE